MVLIMCIRVGGEKREVRSLELITIALAWIGIRPYGNSLGISTRPYWYLVPPRKRN